MAMLVLIFFFETNWSIIEPKLSLKTVSTYPLRGWVYISIVKHQLYQVLKVGRVVVPVRCVFKKTRTCFWDNTDMFLGQHGQSQKYGQQGQKLGQGEHRNKTKIATATWNRYTDNKTKIK